MPASKEPPHHEPVTCEVRVNGAQLVRKIVFELMEKLAGRVSEDGQKSGSHGAIAPEVAPALGNLIADDVKILEETVDYHVEIELIKLLIVRPSRARVDFVDPGATIVRTDQGLLGLLWLPLLLGLLPLLLG